MSRRIIVLDVEADKHDGLVDALCKRPYIHFIPMDREARRQLVHCPACKHKLSKETSFTLNEQVVDSLLKIVDKMKVAKTVILVNKDNPLSRIPPVEHERCVEVDPLVVFRAETLGLLKAFVDGSRPAYYVTMAGIDFLSGERPASPCTMCVLDGEVVELSGEMMIENVKFKDVHRAGSVARDAARAVKALPESVMSFVTSGQMSLI